MRDQAYRRDLRRALEKIVKVKSISTRRDSHLLIIVEFPDGSTKDFTAPCSPSDHQFAVNNMVRKLKRYMKGTP